MDSHGPQQPRFEIFSCLRPSRTFFLQIPTILVSIDSDPPEGPRVPFQMWWGIQISQAPSQIPTIWASMDSHGPQEPRFDIFELTQTLQGVLESHFKFDRKFNFLKLFCKPQQYWYPWTSPGSQQPGINIFELPQTLRGILGSHFKFGGKFNFFLISSQNQTKWVSTDSPRPCQPRFKILELT